MERTIEKILKGEAAVGHEVSTAGISMGTSVIEPTNTDSLVKSMWRNTKFFLNRYEPKT